MVFSMYFIIAVIKPFKLDEVRARLLEAGISGLTVSHVDGFGNQRGLTASYRGQESAVIMHPKIKLEVAVSGDQLDSTIAVIQSAAKTGEIGDGKIFVLPMQQMVRIRTGDTGSDAL